MGGGNSKLNSVKEVIPKKIKPLFFYRYKELTKRRQKSTATLQKETTPSWKKLLKEDGDIKSNNSSDEPETEYKLAVTSPRNIESTNKVTPLPDPDTKYETFTDTENHNADTNQTLQEKDVTVAAANEKDTQEIEETIIENEHEEQVEDQKNNDGHDLEFDDRLLCPSSPSFRIYCLPPQNDKDKNKSQEKLMHHKSSSVESVQSHALWHVKTPSVDSTYSATLSKKSKILNESIETQSGSKRRRNKKKKLRAVKNMIDIKSLYTSCSCVGVDRHRLAVEKTIK